MTAGRGRPPVFDQPAQDEFLRLLTDGVRVGDAADKLGISRRTPTQLATRNRPFAERLRAAKHRGHEARYLHTHPTPQPQPPTVDDEPNTVTHIHPPPAPQNTTGETKLLMLAEVS